MLTQNLIYVSLQRRGTMNCRIEWKNLKTKFLSAHYDDFIRDVRKMNERKVFKWHRRLWELMIFGEHKRFENVVVSLVPCENFLSFYKSECNLFVHLFEIECSTWEVLQLLINVLVVFHNKSSSFLKLSLKIYFKWE